MPTLTFTSRFRRALRRKRRRDPSLADAVERTVQLVVREPHNQGLNLHLLDREHRIWDAYVNRSTRITFQQEGEIYIFRNNCRHDLIDRRQW